MIGVDTERLEATDRDFPTCTLSLATTYLLQETSMAFQAGLPFLVFKANGVSLLGITNRNLWIEIDGQLSARGKVSFQVTQGALLSALNDLKALVRRAQLKKRQWKKAVGNLSSLVLGGVAASKAIDLLFRPPCFGDFYYKDAQCKGCGYRDRCKVEKLKNISSPMTARSAGFDCKRTL